MTKEKESEKESWFIRELWPLIQEIIAKIAEKCWFSKKEKEVVKEAKESVKTMMLIVSVVGFLLAAIGNVKPNEGKVLVAGKHREDCEHAAQVRVCEELKAEAGRGACIAELSTLRDLRVNAN